MLNNFEQIKKVLRLINRYEQLKLKDVTREIVDTMTEALASLGGALLMHEKETESLRAYVHSNVAPFIKFAISQIDKPFNEHRFYLNKKQNLLVKTFLKKKYQLSQKFSDFASPVISEFKANFIQSMLNMHTIISLPVRIDERVLGVLMIGFKEDHLSEEKITLLEIFADQAAIAINNALQYEELRRSHKELKERYEFEKSTTALLSHELKTPIAISYNHIQAFQFYLEKNKQNFSKENYEKLKKVHEDLSHGYHRMNSICSSILQFREVENEIPIEAQKLDLKNSLEPLLITFKARAEKKGLKFTHSIKINSKKPIYGAGIQFEQVLSNLLENAIKYTAKGEVSLKIILGAKTLWAEVSDTGIGLSKKEEALLFERFKRGANAQTLADGLGLGLYMSKKIIEQLGGKIEASNRLDKKGSIFTVELPISIC